MGTGGDQAESAVGRQQLLTRRRFLRDGGIAVFGLVGSRYVLLDRPADAAMPDFVQQNPGSGPSHVVTLRRRDDLLDLRIECWNLVVSDQGGSPRLVRKNKNQPAYLVVVFPPQAIGERAWEAGDDIEGDGFVRPLAAWPADESRLAFEVPAAVEHIDYTLESLLSWSVLVPRVVPVVSGQPDPSGPGGGPAWTTPTHPEIRAPKDTETAIEIPWRLLLSPHAGLGWAHATQPVAHNGRTEIWHTRLGLRQGDTVDEWDPTGRTIQAIYAAPTPGAVFDGENFHSGDDPDTPLKQEHRDKIVKATSDYTLDGRAPADVHRLMLSPLGGWLDVHGIWEGEVGNTLIQEWRHEATMGRDHYVRTVEPGYLFPYGHRAALVTVSERTFEPLYGGAGAVLRQRRFVIVQQPVKSYPAFGQPDSGRAWPFRQLRFTTLITAVDDDNGILKVDDEPVLFAVAAEDLAGRRVDFSTPAIFLHYSDAHEPTVADNQAGTWAGEATRALDLSGQKVTLADPSEPGSDDTALDVRELLVSATTLESPDAVAHEEADQPPFYPKVEQVTARSAGLDQLSGSAPTEPTYAYFDGYLGNGFAAGNKGGVFLESLVGQVVEIAAERAGGLTAPAFDVAGLSRELGPVGGAVADLADIAQNAEFDPVKVFAGKLPKLLGAIDLVAIVEAVTNFLDAPEQALQVKTRPVGPELNPQAIRTELLWEPELKGGPGGLFAPDEGSKMRLQAIFVQSLGPDVESTYDVEGRLDSFALNLLGTHEQAQFIVVHFQRFTFRSRTGHKPEVRPEIGEVKFTGPLEFIDKIREYLTFGGVEPKIGIADGGLQVGVGIQIPTIPLGQVMLGDLAFHGELTIPFYGDPARIRFGLSTRENPFSVTYCNIGGAGYFRIGFDLAGFEGFEFAAEFGAYLPMDFGVVSGKVSLGAGIFFSYVAGDPGTIDLQAYIRFHGSVSVLGLVSVSLDLYIGLGFRLIDNQPKLVGYGVAVLKVNLLIFGGEVRLEIERTIGSTPKRFDELFSPSDWQQYVEAFA